MQNVDSSVPSSDAVRQFLAAPSIAPDAQVVVMAMKAPYTWTRPRFSSCPPTMASMGRPLRSSTWRRGRCFSVCLWTVRRRVGEWYKLQHCRSDIARSRPGDQIVRPTCAASAGRYGDLGPVCPEARRHAPAHDWRDLDHNGHAVPDGTPVDFVVNYAREGLKNPTSVSTLNGIATTGWFWIVLVRSK